jgi:hypothetical protein
MCLIVTYVINQRVVVTQRNKEKIALECVNGLMVSRDAFDQWLDNEKEEFMMRLRKLM